MFWSYHQSIHLIAILQYVSHTKIRTLMTDTFFFLRMKIKEDSGYWNYYIFRNTKLWPTDCFMFSRNRFWFPYGFWKLNFFQQLDGYVPGQDYPIYSEVPRGLSFRCDQRLPGYYSDPEAQCQVRNIRIFDYSSAKSAFLGFLEHPFFKTVSLYWKQKGGNDTWLIKRNIYRNFWENFSTKRITFSLVRFLLEL